MDILIEDLLTNKELLEPDPAPTPISKSESESQRSFLDHIKDAEIKKINEACLNLCEYDKLFTNTNKKLYKEINKNYVKLPFHHKVHILSKKFKNNELSKQAFYLEIKKLKIKEKVEDEPEPDLDTHTDG